MLTKETRATLIVLGITAVLAAGGSAFAQGYEAYPPPQQGAQDFTQSELESFAASQEEVSEISEEFQARMQGTQDPAAMQQMRQEANAEMTAAVRESGLDPATYNAIAAAVRTDPELAAKVEGLQ